MKCEAGKCLSGDNNNKKKLPSKEKNTSIHKIITSKKVNKQRKPKKKPIIEQLFNVRTIQVKSLNTAKEQINYGYIVAKDSSKVDVSTRFSGFVKKLYADTLYAKVDKGDPLVKVYAPEVYKAKEDYINSVNYNKKTSMPQMLKSAKIKLKLLGISEKEISSIASKRNVDEFTTVHAPISGWIFEKNINEGSSFNSKKRLFQIVNLDTVWVEVKLFQDQLEMLNKLKEFKVKVKGIDKEFGAEKILLYPKIDPKEATLTLRLSVDNSAGLLQPGMYVKVHAKASTKTRIVIPRTAAIRKNGTWYSFLATEFKGEYEPIKIDLKPLDTKYYEVFKGLQIGDTLVENALFMMDSDAQINSIY